MRQRRPQSDEDDRSIVERHDRERQIASRLQWVWATACVSARHRTRSEKRWLPWHLSCRFLDSAAPFVLLPFLESKECCKLALTCKRCHAAFASKAKRRLQQEGGWGATWLLQELAAGTLVDLERKHDRLLNCVPASTRRNGEPVSRNRVAIRSAGAALALRLKRPTAHPPNKHRRSRLLRQQEKRAAKHAPTHATHAAIRKKGALHQPRR